MSGDFVIEEELQVLQAVFCKDGEFMLHEWNGESGTACFTITSAHISKDRGNSTTSASVSMKFTIGAVYPQCLPDILITSDILTRKTTSIVKKDLQQYANEVLIGEPMTMQLVEWVQQHLHEYTDEKTINQSQAGYDQNDNVIVTLLRLDHMRARSKYIKTLIGWTRDLAITGRLLFVDKLILVLLEGDTKNIKEFVIRLRTQKVDVDSSGRSCKERMMTVLSETAVSGPSHRYSSFQVTDFENLQHLRKEFQNVGLGDLFEQYVCPLQRQQQTNTQESER